MNAYFTSAQGDHLETPASLSCTSNSTLVVLYPTQEEVARKNIFLSGIDRILSTAFLSIILAVMNLLPIPGLDGGHALFTLWEIITRRKPSEKFLEVAQYVGLMIILALLVYANGNDIYRFFIK